MKTKIYVGDYHDEEEVDCYRVDLKVNGYEDLIFVIHEAVLLSSDISSTLYSVSYDGMAVSKPLPYNDAIQDAINNLRSTYRSCFDEMVINSRKQIEYMQEAKNHELFDFCVGFQKVYGQVTTTTIKNVQAKLKRLGYEVKRINKG